MKKIALTALLLSSSSAFATDTRVSSLQGNVGMADDTDYQRYGANKAGDSAWLDYDGANLGASAGFGDNAVSFAQGDGRVDFGWYNADGDAGYRVLAGIANMDDIAIGGCLHRCPDFLPICGDTKGACRAVDGPHENCAHNKEIANSIHERFPPLSATIGGPAESWN